MSLFSELVREASDAENHKLGSVLLKAKVFAASVKSRKFRQWVNAEINGYTQGVELPSYRIVQATIVGDFDGYRGMRRTCVPLSIDGGSVEMKKALENSRIPNSVASLEQSIENDEQWGTVLSADILIWLRRFGGGYVGAVLNEARSLVDVGARISILNSARSQLLDFLLELGEKYPGLKTDDNAAAQTTVDAVDDILDKTIFAGVTIHGNVNVGDQYSAQQAGAMGPNATSVNTNFNGIMRDAIGQMTLADLAKELEKLRIGMLSEAANAEQDAAVAMVAQAEEAAKKGDAKGVLTYLKGAGKFAAEVAVKLSASVIAKLLEAPLGL